jgi:hypothetical protein
VLKHNATEALDGEQLSRISAWARCEMSPVKHNLH